MKASSSPVRGTIVGVGIAVMAATMVVNAVPAQAIRSSTAGYERDARTGNITYAGTRYFVGGVWVTGPDMCSIAGSWRDRRGSEWFLTAGHCLAGKPVNSRFSRGQTKLNFTWPLPGTTIGYGAKNWAQLAKVSAPNPPPSYDLALIRPTTERSSWVYSGTLKSKDVIHFDNLDSSFSSPAQFRANTNMCIAGSNMDTTCWWKPVPARAPVSFVDDNGVWKMSNRAIWRLWRDGKCADYTKGGMSGGAVFARTDDFWLRDQTIFAGVINGSVDKNGKCYVYYTGVDTIRSLIPGNISPVGH